MSRRYQRGSLCREKRMTGPDIWVFRWRDGTVNRKQQIGTVEKFPTKTKAFKACELLRANINREADKITLKVDDDTKIDFTLGAISRIITAETKKEMKRILKEGSLCGLSQDVDSSEVGKAFIVRHSHRCSRSLAWHVATSERDASEIAKPHARTFQSRDAMGVFRPQPDHTSTAVNQAGASAGCAHG